MKQEPSKIFSKIFFPEGGGDGVLARALDTGRVVQESYEGVELLRLDKDVHGIHRGTVIAPEGAIISFPRIRRILHLERGIKRNLKGPFYVEEKVDGYNVRVAGPGSTVLAFSRGGFVCPFATDRVGEFMDAETFFRDHPRIVLCCEAAGPGSPYNSEWPPYIEEDVRFFVFDMMEMDTGRFLPDDDKYRLIEEYGLPGVRSYGLFNADDYRRVREIIMDLDRGGLEGVVMKPVDNKIKALKYVTPGALLRDLRLTAPLAGDIPHGFYTKRIVLLAFALRELGLSGRGLKERLHSSLIDPLIEAQNIVSEGGKIKETSRIRMRDDKNVERLFSHLRRVRVEVEVVSMNRTDGYTEVEFNRIYNRSTSLISGGLRGRALLD